MSSKARLTFFKIERITYQLFNYFVYVFYDYFVIIIYIIIRTRVALGLAEKCYAALDSRRNVL